MFLAAADPMSMCLAPGSAEREADRAATVPVIAETAWLILDRLGAGPQSRFVHAAAAGSIRPIDLIDEDWTRCAALIDTYADLSLDLVDASVVAVAERIGITTLASLNHRDFTVVRPRHVNAFELIP